MNADGDIKRFAPGEDRGDYLTALSEAEAKHLRMLPAQGRVERHADIKRNKNGSDFKRLKRTGRL